MTSVKPLVRQAEMSSSVLCDPRLTRCEFGNSRRTSCSPHNPSHSEQGRFVTRIQRRARRYTCKHRNTPLQIALADCWAPERWSHRLSGQPIRRDHTRRQCATDLHRNWIRAQQSSGESVRAHLRLHLSVLHVYGPLQGLCLRSELRRDRFSLCKCIRVMEIAR